MRSPKLHTASASRYRLSSTVYVVGLIVFGRMQPSDHTGDNEVEPRFARVLSDFFLSFKKGGIST